MRILPFGDSIVYGEGASGGFRTPLEELLINSGIEFEFVGRRVENSYEMKFPNHEGWERASLSYLREACVSPALKLSPDIILLYAGAEDIKQLPNAGIAAARLEKLLSELMDGAPECKILCSQLVPARDYAAEQKVKQFNSALGAVVDKLASRGAPITRLKMHARVKAEQLNEQGMPTEIAYSSMAELWFTAVDEYLRRKNEVLL